MLGAVNPVEYRVTHEELMQYAAMGTIIHKMAEMVLQGNDNPTHLWTECADEWKLVQEGSLKLNPSAANPQGFMQKYSDCFDWKVLDELIEIEMYDDELLVSGTADLITKYKGKLSLCDWKTSRSYSKEKKEHYFKQLALYAHMYEKKYNKVIHNLVIMPLNPKNKAGFGAPLVTDEVDKYKKLVLKDLEIFNNKFRNDK